MFTRIDIYNMALDRLGSSEPVKSDGDTSLEKRLCEREYPGALEKVLAAYPWSCARKRATLARLADDPPFGWSHAYRLPADFLSLVRIDNNDCPRRKYEIEGPALLCDLERCNIVYVVNEIDASQLPAHVRDLVSIELARRIEPGLRNAGLQVSAQMIQEFWQDTWPLAMAAELRSAFSRNRNERLIDYNRPPAEFIQ